MQKTFTYSYNGKDYDVIITQKSMARRRIHYRFKDDKFYISSPYTVSMKYVLKSLEDKYGPALIKSQRPKGIGEDYIYLFGVRHYFPDSGEFAFSNEQKIVYKSKEEFEKKFRKMFLKILTDRVRYYEHLMKLELHTVRVKKMHTRYGSNSKKTRTVNFALMLAHYSYQIIDAIIVHELAHSLEFNHSKAFYDVVYKYCPDYKVLHSKLRKGEFQ